MPDQHIKELKLLHHTRNLVNGDRIVPALRIEGNLLEKYGFRAGDTVLVTFKKGRLTVKLKNDYSDAIKKARLHLARKE